MILFAKNHYKLSYILFLLIKFDNNILSNVVCFFFFFRNITNLTNISLLQDLEIFASSQNCANIPFIAIDFVFWPTFSIILSIFILGCIGNILTVVIVLCSKKLHTPTFTMIACLAVSDAFSLSVCILVYYTNIDHLMYCSKIDDKFVSALLVVIDLQSRLNAGSQLCILASLRYVAIVNPLKFKINCTTRRIIIISVLGWVVVLLIAISVVCAGSNGFTSTIQLCNILLFINVANFIIPTSIFITLHCLKLRALRRSPALNNKSLVRMNIVITLVLIIYILSASLICIDRTLSCFSHFTIEYDKIAFLLNCAINPFIYFFASPPFLNKFRLMCQRCRCTRNADVVDNINMHVMPQ